MRELTFFALIWQCMDNFGYLHLFVLSFIQIYLVIHQRNDLHIKWTDGRTDRQLGGTSKGARQIDGQTDNVSECPEAIGSK